MGAIFKIRRDDGRSNAQVILDHVKDKPAGTVFSYDELIAALNTGSSKGYSVRDVQGVAMKLYPRLLKEQARALHCVRNVGYRLAPGSQHLMLANDRQTKADKQMLRGMQTLQHVRWNEMDDNQRMAHEGQLLIVGSLYAQMQALERRQTAVEEAIRKSRNGNGDGQGSPEKP